MSAARTWQDLLSRSDVITLHLPLTPDTHHLVDAELLALTSSPGRSWSTAAAAASIDIDAVYAALLDGRLGGIGLDVFDPEPPQHHPLFDHPDVVLTPHLMGLSRQATRGDLHRRRHRASSTCWTAANPPRWPTPAGTRRAEHLTRWLSGGSS